MRSLLITGTDKPHLNLLLAPLRTMGWEVDLDELECMLANLIHRVSCAGHRALVRLVADMLCTGAD